jgi:hypothetical protein
MMLQDAQAGTDSNVVRAAGQHADVQTANSESAGIFGLTRRQVVLLLGAVVAANLPFGVYLLRGNAPVSVQLPFKDDFNRDSIGNAYSTTGGFWRLENGQIHSPGVKNNPLWLNASLPANVSIEFDVRSESSDGDVKFEVFGNGRDHSSGYVIIFGGWSNSVSVVARLDEHGRDRLENRSIKVERGRTYRFRIERRGGLLRWLADGKLMMEYDDPKPLLGRGHDRFGFSSWDSDLFFDNLQVESI